MKSNVSIFTNYWYFEKKKKTITITAITTTTVATMIICPLQQQISIIATTSYYYKKYCCFYKSPPLQLLCFEVFQSGNISWYSKILSLFYPPPAFEPTTTLPHAISSYCHTALALFLSFGYFCHPNNIYLIIIYYIQSLILYLQLQF